MIMTTIILIIGSVVFTALIVIGFLFLLKEHESEPLSAEQVKDYKKKAEEEREYYIKNPALAAANPAAFCNPTISLEPCVHNFLHAGSDGD